MSSTGTLDLDRGSVLAHRMVVQDLAEPVPDAVGSRLLSLGIQNTPAGSALIAINARTTQAPREVTEMLSTGAPLALVLAARGAPHVVSRPELPLLRAALYPLDEQEAADVDEVSSVMREIADGGAISRPDLSAALNGKVSDSLRDWCERCGSRHVREGLFRKATLQAGLEIDGTAPGALFRPPDGPLPAAPDQEEARVELARRYVGAAGVARPADFAAWLGYQAADVKAAWALLTDELTRCAVDGRRGWALTSDVASLSADARRSDVAKLLPPSDPYLMGDRMLVVPERAHQRQLWRAVGSPGSDPRQRGGRRHLAAPHGRHPASDHPAPVPPPGRGRDGAPRARRREGGRGPRCLGRRRQPGVRVTAGGLQDGGRPVPP